MVVKWPIIPIIEDDPKKERKFWLVRMNQIDIADFWT